MSVRAKPRSPDREPTGKWPCVVSVILSLVGVYFDGDVVVLAICNDRTCPSLSPSLVARRDLFWRALSLAEVIPIPFRLAVFIVVVVSSSYCCAH